jgi:hypothetical protein
MSKSGLGCVVLFVAILTLGISLYTTCPTSADHRAALNEVMGEVINDRIGVSEDLMESVLGMAGRYALGKTSDLALSQMLRVENYYLVSVGHITIQGQDHIVSVGILGHVFAPSKEDVEKEIQKYL